MEQMHSEPQLPAMTSAMLFNSRLIHHNVQQIGTGHPPITHSSPGCRRCSRPLSSCHTHSLPPSPFHDTCSVRTMGQIEHPILATISKCVPGNDAFIYLLQVQVAWQVHLLVHGHVPSVQSLQDSCSATSLSAASVFIGQTRQSAFAIRMSPYEII